MKRLRKLGVLALGTCLVTMVGLAQFRSRRSPRSLDTVERGNVPQWQLDPAFARDCFTFVRIKYTSAGGERSSRAWWTDFPDADLNLSYRLHHLTSLRVHPDPKVIELTDPELFRYPFLFMSGIPGIVLSDREVGILRRYLLSGGFVMVDDFWGEANLRHFRSEVIDRVLPGCQIEDLPLDHPIFHCVFDLKQKPQIPNVGFATANRDTGITWEVADGQTPHYWGIQDGKGRLAMLLCHNTDLGDGWEEEATNPYYFSAFSEPKAYPLGINILFYVMTH